MSTSDLALKCNEGASVEGTLTLEHYREGELLLERVMSNLEMDAYKALRANLRIGSGTAPSHIAIGTGTTEEAVDDAAMEEEVDRQAATRSLTTITIEDDTSQYTYTFTLAADTEVTEAGLLNALSDGLLCYHRVFTAVPCLENDTLKVTWRAKS